MIEKRDYYQLKKSALLAQFDGFCLRMGVFVEEKYGEEFKNEAMAEIREEYESILEGIPYIGGDENSLTNDLISAAENLAFYRVLKRHEIPLKEIGELSFKAQEKALNDHPELIPPMNDPGIIPYIIEAANISQQKRYAGDWVYEFIEGNEEFDFGTYFTECGIKKMFHQYGADEFTPYLCAMDILMSDKGKLGLHRTETLAEGGARCDFRYKAGRETKIANTVNIPEYGLPE